MKLKLCVKNIDYLSLISFASETAGHALGLLKHANLNGVAVKTINAGESFLIKKVDAILKENGIELQISKIIAEQVETNAIQIVCTVQQINAASIVQFLQTGFEKDLKKSERFAFAGEALKQHPQALPQGVNAFLDCLDDNEKEQLYISIVNAYKEEIIKAIQNTAEKNRLVFSVTDLLAYCDC